MQLTVLVVQRDSKRSIAIDSTLHRRPASCPVNNPAVCVWLGLISIFAAPLHSASIILHGMQGKSPSWLHEIRASDSPTIKNLLQFACPHKHIHSLLKRHHTVWIVSTHWTIDSISPALYLVATGCSCSPQMMMTTLTDMKVVSLSNPLNGVVVLLHVNTESDTSEILG